jgi:hypothetical protein
VAAHAVGTTDSSSGSGSLPTALRYLDFVLLALALPVFALAGFPLLGWVAAAVAWCLQRAIQIWAERRAARSDELRTVVGLVVGSTIARGFAIVLTLFAFGVGAHAVGLAAAVLVVVLFTVSFPVQILARSTGRGAPSP